MGPSPMLPISLEGISTLTSLSHERSKRRGTTPQVAKQPKVSFLKQIKPYLQSCVLNSLQGLKIGTRSETDCNCGHFRDITLHFLLDS